jgi:hydrogenase expression/formation protein HypE
LASLKKLAQGKLPIEVLKPMLHSLTAGGLVVAPDIGIDVGITRTKGEFLVSSSDPITGVVDRIGWYAVNVSANDVATSGIMPDTLNVVALFPDGTRERDIRKIMDEINETAAGLGISVAGGHTEITPKLDRTIVVVTAIGSGDKYVTSGDAKENDSLLLTKTAGIEGTSILAKLPVVAKQLDTRTRKTAQKLIDKLSIMKEAHIAFETGKAHAMHDVTEGGVLGSALEMSMAAKLGLGIYREKIPIDPTTREVCSKLKIDPLRLIGSGSLLISCNEYDSKQIIAALSEAKIACAEIGTFLPSATERWLESNGKEERLNPESIQDELWPILRKYGDLS